MRRKQFYCWGFDVAAPEWWLIFEERIECVRKNIRHLPLKIKWSDIFTPLGTNLRNEHRQIVATSKRWKPIRIGEKQVKANQKSANSPSIIITTSADRNYFGCLPILRHTTAEYKTRMMGRSFTIQSFVPSPVKFMQVQNGFIRDKERYLDSLNISDCRAFKPIRT